ncbi:hypothetical protein D9757_012038 [Collybiopsis confluens]|uniref:DNA2/NAM7 helicase helicase domain-containing protein n=2 Tax=Collybiopsis confluens TaxID=2823264 RepID=A0A8H5LMK0_9AGAR|nr:hypothetical protein D9757_012038 [Collybiopsis confluens]
MTTIPQNALPLSPKQISVHRHTRQQAASVIAGLRLDPSSIVGISISLKDKGALDHIALATNKDDVHVIDANGPSSKKTDKQLFKILGSCTLAGFMMARIAIRLHHHFQQHVQGVDLSTTFFNSSEAAGHPSAVIERSGLCQLTDTFPVDSLWHGNDTKHAVKKLCLRAWISAQVANHKESLPSLRGAKKVDTKVVQENILLCLGTLVKQNDILARAQPRVLKNEFDALKFNKQGNMVLHNSRFKTRVRLNKDRQSYVEVKNKDGSVFKGRTIGGEGKKTKISFGGALSKTKTPKSISVVGLEDPTAAEKAQESLLLMILQGHVNVLDAPFVRYLWFRSKQDTKLLTLKSARSESNHRSGPYVAHLNSSQGDVVEAMTSTTGSPVVVVHGPPGTGKTTTISSAAEMWLNVYHEPVWIIGHSNVCVKNIAEKLLQRKVDFKLIVSKEFYVEWHEHIYKEIKKHLIRTDRLPKDRVAVSRMIGGSTVILSTLALLSNPALDDNGTFTIVPVENLVVDEASQIDVFDYMWNGRRLSSIILAGSSEENSSRSPRSTVSNFHPPFAPFFLSFFFTKIAMPFSRAFFFRVGASLCLFLAYLASQSLAYFIIDEPASSTQWSNGAANLISWTKGLEDGIDAFDVELARLSDDGLIFVARDVPCEKGQTAALNIFLQNVPPADDYFLLFLNSTPGTMYATSSRFTILDSSSSPSSTQPSTNPSAVTVTISGSPNPTMPFATTFAASSGTPLMIRNMTPVAIAIGSAILSCLLGAVWTLW